MRQNVCFLLHEVDFWLNLENRSNRHWKKTFLDPTLFLDSLTKFQEKDRPKILLV